MKKASRIISMLLALTLFLGVSNFTLVTKAANTEGMTFNATRIYYSDKVMGEAPKTYEAVVKFPAGTDSTTRGGVILGNNGAGKDVVNFEENTFYIIKTNEYKNWHPAMANIDLDTVSENGGEI